MTEATTVAEPAAANQFTPGPWVLDGITISAGRKVVCIMGEMTRWDGFRESANRTADGNVISAAPDLLAAIKDVAFHLDKAMTKTSYEGGEDALEAAEAAIRKAERGE